jgi:hypothetical protein
MLSDFEEQLQHPNTAASSHEIFSSTNAPDEVGASPKAQRQFLPRKEAAHDST